MPKLSKKNRVSKKKSKKNNKNRNRNKTLKGGAHTNVNQSVPKWELGDHVKPITMPSDQWYVLEDQIGEDWVAVHNGGRYSDLKQFEKTWCHRKPDEKEFFCPKIAVETSNETNTDNGNRSGNSIAQTLPRRSKRLKTKY